MECHVKLDPGGYVAEDKKYYLLDEKMRGNGVVKPLLLGLHRLFGNLGIRELKTSAELEAGAYVWARAGYLPTQNSWRRLSGRLRERLEEIQRDLPGANKIEPSIFNALYAATHSSDPRTVWLFSDISMNVNNKKLGYLLLAGEAWKGYLCLDNIEQMNRMRLFLEPFRQEGLNVRPDHPETRSRGQGVTISLTKKNEL